MFKYGSIKLFLIKLIFGIIGFCLGIVYLISLYSFHESDPGFKTYSDIQSELKIKNYFGLYGAYLASLSRVIIGNLSYLFALFILVEGTRGILGIRTRFLILRFFSNLIGIFLLGIFLYSYGPQMNEYGLFSVIVSDLILKYLYFYFSSNVLVYLLNLIILALGIVLVWLSFSIKIKFFKNIFLIIKFLKILKYLKYFFPRTSFIKKEKKISSMKTRSEPTISKMKINKSFTRQTSKFKNVKQLELDQFKFSLPKNDHLLKSNYKTSTTKEINKINIESAEKLEQTLSEYGVEGKVIGFRSGPIVTLFEFIPNAGIKSSKVIGLSYDIARAMSSISARISSQPGKTSLGIEIPNKKRESVLFGDLIEDIKFRDDEDALTLALGKDISGEKIFADLEKMPHLLIAGTTGSGKSVGINTMILSLLYKFKPNECKLILIDPKMLELSIYEDIPHLLTPVVTDPKKAVFALKWVVREMENRYKLMSSINVKNIKSYNEKVIKTISSGRKLFKEVQTGIDPDTRMPIIEKMEIKLEKMPYIVVVIDEMADLMMVAGKEVEALVQRLAQMARASGIHLITATQRPSVDVITGTIKANFPSRISYKVASKFDSRTILNEMGAEQLLGSGDMLLLENGANIKRLHGGYVSENEVENVVSYIKNQATFDYKKEISLENIDNVSNNSNDLISDNNDELYSKAVEIIIKQQKVSTSYVQRYLQIGYNRAARIIEKMEEDGIISEANNAGKRHVLKKE